MGSARSLICCAIALLCVSHCIIILHSCCLATLLTSVYYAAAGAGGLVSVYEVIANPNFADLWPSRSYEASRAANLVRAGKQVLQRDAGPLPLPRIPSFHSNEKRPLLLQLVSHIALEQNAGVVLARSMANRYICQSHQTCIPDVPCKVW